jgi:transposase
MTTKKRRGRPTKLTPELQEKICNILNGGNHIITACDYIGISEKTFYHWLQRGERNAPSDQAGGYSEFYQAVKKARARAEVISVARIRQAGDEGNWQAHAWFLERSNPKRWGRRNLELTGADGGELVIRLTLDDNADSNTGSA